MCLAHFPVLRLPLPALVLWLIRLILLLLILLLVLLLILILLLLLLILILILVALLLLVLLLLLLFLFFLFGQLIIMLGILIGPCITKRIFIRIYRFIPLFRLGVNITDVIVGQRPLLRIVDHRLILFKYPEGFLEFALFGKRISQVEIKFCIFRISVDRFAIQFFCFDVVTVIICFISLAGIVN